jgi:uncharacterized protein YecE (DUF72 family)
MLPPKLRPLADVQHGKVQLTPKLERALTEQFLSEVSPLIESEKLGAFLLQLTPGFSPRNNRLEELDTIFDVLQGCRVAVELRNRHWVDEQHSKATTSFFAERGLTSVSVDAPGGEHFMTMPGTDAITSPKLSYLRLHGRNLKGYVTGRTVAERFDYLYSDQELEEVAQRAKNLARQTAETHVIYNNNCSDYALRNAATFQKMIDAEQPQTAPTPDPPHGRKGKARPGQTLEFDFGKTDP